MDAAAFADFVNSAAGADISGLFDEADPRRREMAKMAALEDKAEHERLAGAVARLLDTDDGRIVIEHMLDVTLRRIAFTVQFGVDPMHSAFFGAFREGQNALVAALLKLYAEGKDKAPPPAREP